MLHSSQSPQSHLLLAAAGEWLELKKKKKKKKKNKEKEKKKKNE